MSKGMLSEVANLIITAPFHFLVFGILFLIFRARARARERVCVCVFQRFRARARARERACVRVCVCVYVFQRKKSSFRMNYGPSRRLS